MWVGTNAHPIHGYVAADLQRYDVVRYPVWQDQPQEMYQTFTRELAAQGTMPLIVMDMRTLATPTRMSYTRRMQRLLRLYPECRHWQVENEVDQPGSESSHYMPPADYRRLLEAADRAFSGEDVTIIASGMVSGDPNYLVEVDAFDCYDVLAIHPYGMYPVRYDPHHWGGWGFGDVMNTIEHYKQVLTQAGDKPVWVTEFGAEDSTFLHLTGSAPSKEAYVHDMLVELSDHDVEAALVYCWRDDQGPGFGTDGKFVF